MERAEIKNGDYSFSVLSHGAILESFKYKDQDIIVGYENSDDYQSTKEYFSEVVGPFANRIKGAEFRIGDEKYTLEKNNGKNNLHSGSKNFGYHDWKIEETGKDFVRLSLSSPEEGGFPGSHTAQVKYSLTENGTLRIDYLVESDKKCPVNITNHAFFNLSGGKDIRNTYIKMNADRYIAVDDELIPTEVKSVINTDFDFRASERLSDRREGAYDHCFIFADKGKIVAEGSLFKLTVETDLPAVQLYTGKNIDSDKIGKNGIELKAFSGFCLETEFYPDFPNRSDFQGAYTFKGNPFRTYTTFHLEKR